MEFTHSFGKGSLNCNLHNVGTQQDPYNYGQRHMAGTDIKEGSTMATFKWPKC